MLKYLQCKLTKVGGIGHATVTYVILTTKISFEGFWQKLSSKANKGLLFPKLWVVVVYMHVGLEVLGFE